MQRFDDFIIKRMICIMLVPAMIVGTFSACSGKDGSKKNSSSQSLSASGSSVDTFEDQGAESMDETSNGFDSGSNPNGGDNIKSGSGSAKSVSGTQGNSSANPIESLKYKVTLQFEKQEADIIREDSDRSRRLIYFRINNNGVAIKDCSLYYQENGKTVTREIGLIYLNQIRTYETLWIDSSFKGQLSATLKNKSGEVLWEGTINIEPATKTYTIKKSKCYSINEIKPMMLRGVNYFNRYQHWGKDWDQNDFSKEWDSDFKDIGTRLNANTARVFSIFREALLLEGQVPKSETLIKVAKFLEIIDKYKIKAMMCIFAGEPKISENMGDNLRFLRGVVEPFKNDGRILIWDLTNEPDDDNYKTWAMGDLGSGGYLDTFIKTMYPKLKNELAPNQMTLVGTGWHIEKLDKLKLNTQIGSYHGYTADYITEPEYTKGLIDRCNAHWNGKSGPWINAEFGMPTEETGDAVQLKMYRDVYFASAYKLRDQGYNLLGLFPWCVYDYPTLGIKREDTNGLIRKDGSFKPAGEYVAGEYQKIKNNNKAPWE